VHDLNLVLAKFTACDILLAQPSNKTLFMHASHGASAEAWINQDVHLVLCLETYSALLGSVDVLCNFNLFLINQGYGLQRLI
jgi:hypothetical protein